MDDINSYKIILVGDTSVGKSCIVQQFVENKIEDKVASTIGCEYVRLCVSVGIF
jgi:GTPase SAR1 family protein